MDLRITGKVILTIDDWFRLGHESHGTFPVGLTFDN